MRIDDQDYKIRLFVFAGQSKEAVVLAEELFDDLDQMNAFIEGTCHLAEYSDAEAQYTFAENFNGKVAKEGWYYYDIVPYEPLQKEDFEDCLEDAFRLGPYPDDGYVIRSFDAFRGVALYRGRNHVVSIKKDAIQSRDTYNLTGARKALTSLTNRHQEDMFYSIERLTSHCPGHDLVPDHREIKDLDKKIALALQRLDELCDNHEFRKGDKMRINEVRKVMKYIRERETGDGSF